MKNILDMYRSASEFKRNVATLMTGTTIAQAIPIAFMPLLTRLYTPEEFGLYAIYLSLATVLALMATGRYELAVMLPDNDRESLSIVVLSMLITFSTSFAILLIVIIFYESILESLGNDEIGVWLYFLPLSVFIAGVYQTFNYWLNRQKKYTKIALSKIVQTSSNTASSVGLGMAGQSAGMIVGNLVGQFVASIVLIHAFIKTKQDFGRVDMTSLMSVLRQYKKMPLYNLPNAVLESARIGLLNIVISRLFSTAAVGYFSLGWRMLQIPTVLIGNSLSQVFLQKLSSINKNEFYSSVKSFALKISIMMFPVFLAIYILSEEVFAFVFGENWRIAGTITSLLTPWMYMKFIAQPLSGVFVVLNRQEIVFIFSIINLMLLIAYMFYCSALPLLDFVMGISLIMTASLAFLIMLAVYYSNKVVSSAEVMK